MSGGITRDEGVIPDLSGRTDQRGLKRPAPDNRRADPGHDGGGTCTVMVIGVCPGETLTGHIMPVWIGRRIAQAHEIEHLDRVIAVEPLEDVKLHARGIHMADQILGEAVPPGDERQRLHPFEIVQPQLPEEMREFRAPA